MRTGPVAQPGIARGGVVEVLVVEEVEVEEEGQQARGYTAPAPDNRTAGVGDAVPVQAAAARWAPRSAGPSLHTLPASRATRPASTRTRAGPGPGSGPAPAPPPPPLRGGAGAGGAGDVVRGRGGAPRLAVASPSS